jgi:hypothetical protein
MTLTQIQSLIDRLSRHSLIIPDGDQHKVVLVANTDSQKMTTFATSVFPGLQNEISEFICVSTELELNDYLN